MDTRHTIAVRLTEAAQRTAMLAGLPAQREQTFTVEAADLPTLLGMDTDISAAGEAHYDAKRHREGTGYCGDWLNLDECPRDGAHAISLVQAKLDGLRQAAEAKATEAKATEAASAVRRAEEDRATEERVAAAGAARDAAARRSAARLRRLVGIVREHGSEADRGRLDAGPGPLGMMPEAEAMDLARDVRLPLQGRYAAATPGVDFDLHLAPYALLDSDDLRTECDESCHEPDPSYLTEAPEALTAEEWEAVQSTRVALKAAGLPEGTLRRHKGQCDRRNCPAWPVSRLGILVELDLGDGLVVKREYAVG